MRSYATTQEFLNHPTGLEVSDLVAGGDSGQQTDELALLLQAASSSIDQWCFHPLYAHSKTETKRVKPDPYGTLTVRCNEFPISSVTSAQWRQFAINSFQAIDLTKIDIFPELGDGHKYVAGDMNYGPYHGWGQPPLTVQTTYVAGYPNMQLTGSVTAGDTSLTVDTTLGVTQGDTLKIYDGTSYEEVLVESVADNVITLTAGCQNAHVAGVRVSEVPDVIWLSCILSAAYMIKERRAGASIMMQGTIQPQNVIDAEDMQLVRQYLQPFRRVI
ncbi:hypothetical protein [Alicyclobacillus sp. ALC3]|uniref:hypothetical protein n=1 Tax=Alicyclobacillus sp. ALC3 TaxID=2796143 RepID=UPI002378B08B|nr:hypothetical protein [Alicyclobacillus sp. ALC3]WDL96943.1 hypothetical protein JC200_22135 [Alicyclobacillus sp. ALC3]